MRAIQVMRNAVLTSVAGWVITWVAVHAGGQLIPQRLPDTGQTVKYTKTHGEDADYSINPPSFTDAGDGTIMDNVTGLMWQKADAGEMTWDTAGAYASELRLAGHDNWRLPTARELFGILNHGRNPALDPSYFPRSAAEYWWSSEPMANDANRVWVTNSGGGIGPHPRSETVSAGGPKRFHVRCVRGASRAAQPTRRFAVNGDGTVADLTTGLTWQQAEAPGDLVWEEALRYAEALSLGGKDDWRLPNIKELQSLSDETRTNPSTDREVFPGGRLSPYWSSTTVFGRDSGRAWVIDFRAGIGTYDDKTVSHPVRCVRGG